MIKYELTEDLAQNVQLILHAGLKHITATADLRAGLIAADIVKQFCENGERFEDDKLQQDITFETKND